MMLHFRNEQFDVIPDQLLARPAVNLDRFIIGVHDAPGEVLNDDRICGVHEHFGHQVPFPFGLFE